MVDVASQGPMGQIHVEVLVENAVDRARRIECVAMVDTGAFGLVLPSTWRERLGEFSDCSQVDLEMADQRVVTSEICGPVRIRIDGFRWLVGEVIFVDMEPGPGGRVEPLVGYHVLESCNVVVDMVRHRLVARKHYDLKHVDRRGPCLAQPAAALRSSLRTTPKRATTSAPGSPSRGDQGRKPIARS